MKFSTMACLFGSALVLAGAGVSAVACSSSSGGGGTITPQKDGSSPGDSSQPTPETGSQDTNVPPTDSPAGDAGSDACGDTPTLHPGTVGGGIYCPFGPDSGTLYCGAADGGEAADPICCISGQVGSSYPPSICGASVSGCGFQADAGNTTVQCEDPATDCPAANVCCGKAESNKTPTPYMTCGYDKLSDWESTTCVPAATGCAAGDFQLCTSNAECTAPATCTPFKSKGLDLGWCTGGGDQ
jgi:hypothetical protein